MKIAVVIPAWNEARYIAAAVLAASDADRVLVVDAGSEDDTAALAQKAGATVVDAPRGYANQANAGAAAAEDCDVLLFVAADSRLGIRWREALEEVFRPAAVVAGGFRLRIDDGHPFFRFVEFGGNYRALRDELALPDQGLFVRRTAFKASGGFDPRSLVPHAALCLRLREQGDFRIVPPSTMTSSRKWRSEGMLRTVLGHRATYRQFLQVEASSPS